MLIRLERAALLLILFCLAVFVPKAHADYESLSSGLTKLSLDKSFVRALHANGISLSAEKSAKVQGRVVTFPVAGGKLDPTTARGVIDHDGVLLFRSGKNAIPLKELQLKTSRQGAPFAAKVGGSQLKLASGGKLEVARAGFGETITTSELVLSAKLATRLAKKLDARAAFRPNMPLGRTHTKVSPATIGLVRKNKVDLSLAPEFQAKLNSLFVAVNPVFPAEHPGAFTFPIFGGDLARDGSQGRVETEGALEFLQLGGGQVLWHEPWLDLGVDVFSPEPELLPSPPYAGKEERAGVASLSQIAASAQARNRTINLSGQVLLDAHTAAIFNEMFAKPQDRENVFVPGEILGHVLAVGKGQ